MIWTVISTLVLLACFSMECRAAMLHPFDMEESLIETIQFKGGVVNARVGLNQDGIRGLFASRDLKTDDIIMSIPPRMLFNIGSKASTTEELVVHFIRETHAKPSRHHQYLQTLPKAGEAINYYNFPLEYLPMLRSDILADQIKHYQQELESMVSGVGDESRAFILDDVIHEDDPVTLEELKEACAVIFTHDIYGFPRPAIYMVPIFDLTNYKWDSPNYITHLEESPNFDLKAGADIKEGEEIFYDYGLSRDDDALLRYGFLPPVLTSPLLMSIDKHLNETQVSEEGEEEYLEDEDYYPTEPVKIEAEIKRLEAILLEIDEMAAKSPNPPPLPKLEHLHDLLLSYQSRRVRALNYVIARLQMQPGKAEL